jgi:hypothetical protein
MTARKHKDGRTSESYRYLNKTYVALHRRDCESA